MSSPSQLVLTFLESVGRRQEAEYYLRLFQTLPKASFATIAAHPQLFDNSEALLVQPLRFLSRMGLHPVLATGLFDEGAGPAKTNLAAQLSQAGVPNREVSAAARDWLPKTRQQLESGGVVLAHFEPLAPEARLGALALLLTQLNTRKLAVTRPRGGLGKKEPGVLSLTPTHHLMTDENGINVVNLTSDFSTLSTGDYLNDADRSLLQELEQLHRAHPPLVTSVTSPLNLLRELFTVRGAGTLVKTGTSIVSSQGYEGIDTQRLTALLEETFGRRLRTDFIERIPLNVYREQEYRGVAIVTQAVEGAFLSKFAVNRKAQGEGIGRDLWEAMLRDHPVVYWRARAQNPANDWYRAECDGMQRVGDWRVYWRGVDAARIPVVIDDAMCHPFDFQESSS